jgi:hypothetical protein
VSADDDVDLVRKKKMLSKTLKEAERFLFVNNIYNRPTWHDVRNVMMV